MGVSLLQNRSPPPGFWYPYRNIFGLTDELGLRPFTDWTQSSQYSPFGLEVESPIFQDMPRLPSPLGTFVWTQVGEAGGGWGGLGGDVESLHGKGRDGLQTFGLGERVCAHICLLLF